MAGYTIGLDVQDMSAPVSLNVKQGESGRTINIALTNGGRPYPIPKGAYAVFAGKKPDEKILWNSCTIVDNNIHYEITKQTTAVTGWVPVQIRLYSAGGKLLVTPDFVLIVDAPVTGDEELVTVSQNEVTALTELITEADSLKDMVFTAEYGITTYQEIKEAKDDDKVIVCKKENGSTVLKLHKVDQFEAEFSAFYDGRNKIWAVSRSDEWSESYTDYLSKEETEKAIEDSVSVFVATYGETTDIEIYEESAAGKAVFCKNGNCVLPLRKYQAGSRKAIFEGTYGGQIITYTVQIDAWTETAKELIEQLTVVISGPVASHSASEIIAAIKAEKIVEVNMGTERLQVTAWDESAVTVTCKKAPAPNRGGALISCNEYTIRDDKKWDVVANNAISTNFTAKAGQAIVVTNSDPSGPTAFGGADIPDIFTAQYGTTTFTEIANAVSAKKTVECRKDYIVLPMLRFSPQAGVITFGGTADGQSVTWKLHLGVWSESNVQIETGGGGNAGTLKVNVTSISETEAEADKTFAEIQTALSEGREVFVHIDGKADTLRLDAQDENAIAFAKVGTYASEVFAEINATKVVFHSDGTVLWEEGYTSVPSESTVEQLYVMKPDTAEVGQTIVVDEVDENGRPIHWSAMDLPTGGGGGSEEWEHICDIVPDGTTWAALQDFDNIYKKIKIFVSSGANAIASTSNNSTKWKVTLYFNGGGDFRNFHIGFRDLSAWTNYYGIAEIINDKVYTIGIASGFPAIVSIKNIAVGNYGINKIQIEANSTEILLLSNTFSVYGVRA